MFRLLSTALYRLASAIERLARTVDPRFRHARAVAHHECDEMFIEAVIARERRESMRMLARTPSDTAEHRVPSAS